MTPEARAVSLSSDGVPAMVMIRSSRTWTTRLGNSPGIPELVHASVPSMSRTVWFPRPRGISAAASEGCAVVTIRLPPGPS
jgi:hypothetical protein